MRWTKTMIICALLALLVACGPAGGFATEPPAEAPPAEEPADGEPTVSADDPEPPSELEAAGRVLEALRDDDLSALADWAHPEKGVRFSPYAYVNVESDLTFLPDELEALENDETPRVWGTHAGSGEPIEMTFEAYRKSFVYDADFVGEGAAAVNRTIGQSTTIDNLEEVYPSADHVFVEFHIKGVDPAVEGMDWRSLRLVFEKDGDALLLVGVVHDQWTP